MLRPRGLSTKELLALSNHVLQARGLAPVSTWSGLQKRYLATGTEGVERRNAKVVAEIVAEYAEAAPAGESAKLVLERVHRDYPTIRRMDHYAGAWQREPEQFPALASFFDEKKLVLRGLGKPPPKARYIGGWKPERLLGEGDGTQAIIEKAKLAGIPLGFPLLDAVKARFGNDRALDATNLLWVTHLYADNYPLMRALRAQGLHPENTFVVGSPYGSSDLVRRAYEEEGIEVRIPALDPAAYRAEVGTAIDRVLARRQLNDRRIVVIDDGGTVADILSEPKYADERSAFRIVEQTTQGIMVARRQDTQVPVIAVARSKSKAYEGKFIAQVVARKLRLNLERIGERLDGKTVAVLGAGFIGEPIAAELAGIAKEVLVVETEPARAAALERQGFVVVTKAEALGKADVVIGATGMQSLTMADMRQLKSGAVVASASSKQVELDMDGLRKAARAEPLSDLGEGALPNVKYRLGKRDVVVLGDGWPVNLDRSMGGLPLEQIQLTMSALFAGVVQASRRQEHRNLSGIIPLDDELDAFVLSEFKRLEKTQATTRPGTEPWRAKLEGAVDLISEVDYDTFDKKQLVLDPESGRPVLGLTKTRLAQLAADWHREVSVARGDVASFVASHGLEPQWISRLRGYYPALFPARMSVPTDPGQVAALAAEWDAQVLTGKQPVTAFRRTHRLRSGALTMLRDRNPGCFAPRFEVTPHGEARIAELAQRWKQQVVTGERSVAEFCDEHDISNQILGYYRKRDASLFPVTHPHRLRDSDIEALDAVWKAKVVTGGMTSAQFFEQQPISINSVVRIRRSRPELFPVVNQRVSLDDAKALDTLWRAQVVTGKVSAIEFGRLNDADSKKISYLRTRFPELFPRIRAGKLD